MIRRDIVEKVILNGELTKQKLQEILSWFYINQKPKLDKSYNYFLGKQEINNKVYSDKSKPCNRIVVNFCHQIVQQYLGFNIGIPVTYEVDDGIKWVLDYNDVVAKDNVFLRNALIYGKSYEIQYLDEDGIDRFDSSDTRFSLEIYGDELNQDEPKYFIRIYCIDNTDLATMNNSNWRVEVYDKDNIYTYSCNYAYSNLNLIDTKPHYFGQVPVVVFDLNEEAESIFGQIMSLQDAYNKLLSSEVDDWEAFVDCYLLLKNVQADAEDVAKMKTDRVLVLDGDSDADYLTKNVNTSQIQELLTNVKEMIFKMSNAPDFSDPNFMAQSGIALQYKLTGFNNVSKAIMNRMERALRKRIELIQSIDKIVEGTNIWTDVGIKFTQNIPANITDAAQIVNILRGVVSTETLLGLLPFVTDIEKEMQKIEKENKANADLYSFTATEEQGEGDVE